MQVLEWLLENAAMPVVGALLLALRHQSKQINAQSNQITALNVKVQALEKAVEKL